MNPGPRAQRLQTGDEAAKPEMSDMEVTSCSGDGEQVVSWEVSQGTAINLETFFWSNI